MKKLIVPVFGRPFGRHCLTLSAGEPDANPTGTWKVTISGGKTQALPAVPTLKLKLSGDMLTGTLSYRSSPLSTASRKSPNCQSPKRNSRETISLSISPILRIRERGQTPPIATRQDSGDTIKGTFTSEWMGNTNTKRTWQAERIKE